MNAIAVTPRPARRGDAADIVGLINRESQAVLGEDLITISDLEREWNEPEFRIDDETRVLECRDGRIVGYADYTNRTAPHVRAYGFCSIDPELGARVPADLLTGWLIDRARSDVRLAPPDTRITLLGGANQKNALIVDAWTRAGFTVSRHFVQMAIALDRRPEPAEVPAGYQVRTLRAGEERALFDVLADAFRDHYGFVDPAKPDEEYERWRRHVFDADDFDPDLMIVATAPDGSIVGGAVCRPSHGAQLDMGWVGTLGVNAAHRRQRLGESLLRRSFEVFHEKGKLRAGLGVDSESLTNATRLYEKCGMQRFRVYLQMALVIRDGRELAKLG
jgi:mycothiol synthase